MVQPHLFSVSVYLNPHLLKKCLKTSVSILKVSKSLLAEMRFILDHGKSVSPRGPFSSSSSAFLSKHEISSSLGHPSPPSLPSVFIPHPPSPTHPSASSPPAVTSQQALHRRLRAPAITIAIKRCVIAELRAMSSILRTRRGFGDRRSYCADGFISH